MTQKLKFSPETINVLRNFSGINKSLIFRKGNQLDTISISKSVMASATVAETFEIDFAISDLSRFLSALSLFSDPELNLNEKFLTIKEGKKKLNYTYANPSHIQTITPEEVAKLEAMLSKGDVEFPWENSVYSDVNKALLVMKLPEFEVSGDGAAISLKALDSKNPTGDNYSAVLGDGEETFSAIFKAENIRFLPLDYVVKYSTKIGAAQFKSDGVVYYVTTEAKKK